MRRSRVAPPTPGARLRPRGMAAATAALTLLAAPVARAQEADPGVAVGVPAGDEYSDTDPSALTDFRPALDPYGQWVDDPTYGTAWTPDAAAGGQDFEPYDTSGRWDYTGTDYTWISDYPWGWVCFHYGRWIFAGGRWLWVPGRQYAGAWVDWRVGDGATGMLGWAPVAPSWGWAGGSAFSLGFPSSEPWAFAPVGSVFAPDLSSHVTFGDIALPLVPRTQLFTRTPPGGSIAQPTIHGPPPASLGIDFARIPHLGPSANELRARQLAHPSTAVAIGARAPTPHVLRRRTPALVPRTGGTPPRSAGRGRR